MKKNVIVIIAIFLLSFFLCSCKAETVKEDSFFAMDTFISIQCSGHDAEEAVSMCKKEIDALDRLFRPSDDSSDVFKINHSDVPSVEIQKDTSDLLAVAKDISEYTDGSFDITIRPLVELWGFETDTPHVPFASDIESRLPIKGSSSFQTDSERIHMNECISIDFGGIAKGYCTDKMKDILDSKNVSGAIVSLGGNILAYKEKSDGTPWAVAVMDPKNPDSYAGILKVKNRFVITSGSYQRNFTENGKEYHHILDPKTGYPVDNNLLSVTVISKNGASADALSTAFFVMGYEKAKECYSKLPEKICPDAVLFVTKDNSVYTIGDTDFTVHGDYSCIKEEY